MSRNTRLGPVDSARRVNAVRQYLAEKWTNARLIVVAVAGSAYIAGRRS